MRLSPQARVLWAKTGSDEQSNLWEPLYVHMLDSAAFARILWREWLAQSMREYMASAIGLAVPETELIVAFVAGIHDIGKATPNFQQKVPERAEPVASSGLKMPSRVPASFSHAYMGQVALERILLERGWSSKIASGYASIIGGHHGSNPSSKALQQIKNETATRPEFYLGGETWLSVRCELFELVGSFSGTLDCEGLLQEHRIPTNVQVLLTGLTIMSDWITSNTDYFPLVESIVDESEICERAKTAWEAIDLPCAERFNWSGGDLNALFRRRFPALPSDARLRPLQRQAVESAYACASPSLTIVEAPMGCGKTEASLLCAEALAGKHAEGGVAYLLPTQATTNAMYSRVEPWLANVHADNGSGAKQDIHLLHAKAALNADWKSRATWGASWMGDEADGQPDDAIVAHQWFSGRKRGLLAPFVVGTVDQLLFMALKAKHVHLRHLGLAGKVVVIDEVHAYDAYMNVYLDRALSFLGRYQVPVILLSATLPARRRQELIRAYRGQDGKGRRRSPIPPVPRAQSGAPAYPLVTCASSDKHEDPIYAPCENDGRRTDFEVEFIADDDTTLLETLRSMLRDGGCVCVLRNTVRRAQEAYQLLKDNLDSNVLLVHSRFIALDRAKNDALLLDLLGPDAEKRPQSLVVVGTQVIEQSLDIDFDAIITDVAPVDLLLQRMGRVHRHGRGPDECERPLTLRRAQCVITGIEEWDDDGIPAFESGTSYVYQQEVLLRSILALRDAEQDGICHVLLPDDISSLVEKAYDFEGESLSVPEDWQKLYEEAEVAWNKTRDDRMERAQSWLLGRPPRLELTDWMDNKTDLGDEVRSAAKVRDTQESIEVVLVTYDIHGYRLLDWVTQEEGVDAWLGDGTELPPDDVAHAAALCTVSLPPVLCASYRADKVIEFLERAGHFDGWQRSRWLKGTLPLVLDADGRADICIEDKNGRKETFIVSYDREKGLVCEKGEGEP